MSRSYLHDKYKREQAEKYCEQKGKHSSHQQDEAPKNRPSKWVTSHGGSNADWYQEPSNFSGHRVHKNGHTMVSGIVRANVKEELRKELQERLDEESDIISEVEHNAERKTYQISIDDLKSENAKEVLTQYIKEKSNEA